MKLELVILSGADRELGRATADPSSGEAELRNGRLCAVWIAGRRVPARAAFDGQTAWVWAGGRTWRLAEAARTRPAQRHGAAESEVRAPMPGKVLRVLASEGDSVRRGQPILVLEAMKMEHEIRAPADGRIVRLPFREGDRVDAGVELAEIGG